MKRIVYTIAASLLLVASAQAANVFKFTFTDVDFPEPDGFGTIRAGVKIVKRSSFTVCEYFSPSDQYLGKYQNTDNNSSNAADVEKYCLDNYARRVTR